METMNAAATNEGQFLSNPLSKPAAILLLVR